jgi:GT2 family glycosyltransferase
MLGRILAARALRKLAPEGTSRRDLVRRLRRRIRHLRRRFSDVIEPALPVWPSNSPRISLLIPVRLHKEIRAVLRTIEPQSYSHWEIVFIVAADRLQCWRGPAGRASERIRFLRPASGVDHQNCLEEARRHASGDYIGVMSAGDALEPNALAEMVEQLMLHPELDVLYCDEDCISAKGRRHSLQLKPDWSPEMLLGFNYIGRLCLIRADVLHVVGGFDARFEDAQEYESLLRIIEKTAHVGRLPKCLYHRLARPLPRANFAIGSGAPKHRETALREHLRRQGHDARVFLLPDGLTRVEWPIVEPPLVSIIIPTLNQPAVLKQCVEDLRRRTDYPRREIILVDNGSTDAQVIEYYRELTEARAATVVPFRKKFNYSEACNLGARRATGDLLLFMNNDISVINPAWLAEMVRFAMRPGVGCVGTKLLYPNGRIQHVGTAIGLVNLAFHLFYQSEEGESGAFGSPNMYRNLSAVTGACQMFPRRAFDAVGGFDERYRIEYSDVAICLHLREAGLRTVYTPYAPLLHHESLTRGGQTKPDDMALFAFDLKSLNIVEDPYFHPALSHQHSTPALRGENEPASRDVLRDLINRLSQWPDIEGSANVLDKPNVWSCPEVVNRWPAWAPNESVRSEWDAARLALDLLRRSPMLRDLFPKALSEGTDGGYCRWLCAEALDLFGLQPTAGAHIQNAFRDNPGRRVRRLYESRWGSQNVLSDPSATSRAGFVRWLLAEGQAIYRLRDEEIWWFLIQSAEDPLSELVHAYSITPVWQSAFPEAMTDLGWPRFYRWAQPFWFPNGDPMRVPEFRSTKISTSLDRRKAG